jgi:general transcriptional corepressor CYC8
MKLTQPEQQELLDQAQGLVRDKKNLHAVQLYTRLIASEPLSIDPYSELASLFTELGQHQAGVDVLRRAERRFPDSVDLVFQLARLYVRSGNFDKAVTCFKKYDGQKIPDVHFNLGLVYYFKNDLKRAEEQFRLTVKINPNHPKVNESLGEVLLKRGAYTEAVEWLTRSVDAQPGDAFNHHLLGLAYTKLDNWKKAHAEFSDALKLDPGQCAHWEMCGKCLFQMHEYESAKAHMLKALAISPQSIDALIYLGKISFAQGNRGRALRYYQQALELDPKNIQARALSSKLRTPVEKQIPSIDSK